jgi:hypothetical protein
LTSISYSWTGWAVFSERSTYQTSRNHPVRRIAKFVDAHIGARGASHLFELQDGEFLQWGRRCRFNGMIVGGDVLVLDHRMFSAFRMKISNLLTLQSCIHCYRPKEPRYDSQYLTAYFAENHDNPYALWNVLQTFIQPEKPEELTQFPPLYYAKDPAEQRTNVDRMRALSRPGDLFFTFDRTSGLSRLIRSWDRGMWSHCGVVGYGGQLYEQTTSGAARSEFASRFDAAIDVGLYRFRQHLADEGVAGVVDYWERKVAARAPYGWGQVFRTALAKKFRMPIAKRPLDITPADLMYANTLQMVCYA